MATFFPPKILLLTPTLRSAVLYSTVPNAVGSTVQYLVSLEAHSCLCLQHDSLYTYSVGHVVIHLDLFVFRQFG